ncbi:hypothetical protein EHM69_02320 [candidate division KSB1 bacterium]|nr:MAG: hypothetical protein EHM69_02320 [candidate division KSB1 bacterium]
MISFLIGALISAVAAIPAFLLAWSGRKSELKQRLRLWAVGLLVRFAVIGAALIILFTQTTVARIPVVAGVAVIWLISYVLESIITLRA